MVDFFFFKGEQVVREWYRVRGGGERKYMRYSFF